MDPSHGVYLCKTTQRQKRHVRPFLESGSTPPPLSSVTSRQYALYTGHCSIYALVSQLLSTRVIFRLRFWTNSAPPLFYSLCFDQHKNQIVCEEYNSGSSLYSSLFSSRPKYSSQKFVLFYMKMLVSSQALREGSPAGTFGSGPGLGRLKS